MSTDKVEQTAGQQTPSGTTTSPQQTPSGTTTSPQQSPTETTTTPRQTGTGASGDEQDEHDEDDIDDVDDLVDQSNAINNLEDLLENLSNAVILLIDEHKQATQEEIDTLRDNWLKALDAHLPPPPDGDTPADEIRQNALVVRATQELLDRLRSVLLQASEEQRLLAQTRRET
jgi:type II secretory pathway component GspD/PulD (secretin)